MKGKVLRDLMYCEVYVEDEHDPEDTALHEGDMIDVLRDFKEFNEDTYLCFVYDEDNGSWQYVTLQMVDVVLVEDDDDQPT